MVERMHRTLKAALRCCGQSWLDALPTVLLELRNVYKEDLEASPAEMLFGTALRLPGEFFASETAQADTTAFVRSLRQLFRSIRPVPASKHSQHHPFFFKDLRTCSHVFKRVDSIRKPLEPPYTGPHRVIRRVDDRSYIIEIDGEEKSVTTDQLKPAYLEVTEAATRPVYPAQPPTTSTAPTPQATSDVRPTKRITSTPAALLQVNPDINQPVQPLPSPVRHVSFPALPELVTGEGVDVATPTLHRGARHPRKQTLVPRECF